MMEIVAATHNAHKVREFERLLPDFTIVGLPDDAPAPEENGVSFQANALIKARAAHSESGKAAFADDSGIEANGLDGRPGIYSARFAGPGASDKENLDLLLEEVSRSGEDRRVRYVCVIAYVDVDGTERTFTGTCDGTLAQEPRGSGGFGYDPAFVPEATGASDRRTMAELSEAEKHAISHRGIAARAMREFLSDSPDSSGH